MFPFSHLSALRTPKYPSTACLIWTPNVVFHVWAIKIIGCHHVLYVPISYSISWYFSSSHLLCSPRYMRLLRDACCSRTQFLRKKTEVPTLEFCCFLKWGFHLCSRKTIASLNLLHCENKILPQSYNRTHWKRKSEWKKLNGSLLLPFFDIIPFLSSTFNIFCIKNSYYI